MASEASEATTAAWVEKARSLGPIIQQHRDESERQRRLSSPVYEAMRDLGLFKLWLPKSLGGEELDIEVVLRVVEQVARFDGSTAWNLCIGLQGGLLMGFLPLDVAADMLRDQPNATIGGSAQRNGIATRVDGGYRVSGRWAFLSGGNHTRWLAGNSVIHENGAPVTQPDGSPDPYFFFFSSDQYAILDTWYTTGLRATGSNDMVVEDAFVPEGRKIRMALLKSPHQPGPLYQTRLSVLLGAPLSAVGLGIAEEAVEAFRQLAERKTPNRASKRLADNDYVQMSLGRAIARINAGRAYLYEAMCDKLWPAMQAGKGDADEVAAEAHLAAANAAESAAEAVDILHSLAGSSAIYEGNPIERCFRDVHMVTQHTGTAASNYARAGALKLGLGYSMGR